MRTWILAPLLLTLAPCLARAQESLPWNLLDWPDKAEPEAIPLDEVVACTLSLPSASLFDADEILGTAPREFLVDEMYAPFRVFHVDESCALIATWTTAWTVPPVTETGLTYDEAAGTYWVVDPFVSGTIQEFTFGTGIPTATPPVALAPVGLGQWGPMAIDNNQAGKLAYVEQVVADVAVEYDLINGYIGCTFPNPDNVTGDGAFGNGLDDAADWGACAGATLVISSGLLPPAGPPGVQRVSQADCSGTLCYETWDLWTPLAPFGEPFTNGIVEFISPTNPCSERRLLAVGNATSTLYFLAKLPGSPAGCVAPDPSLLGWWTLDDGIAADHEGCSNGALVGALPLAAGKVACALTFGSGPPGTGYVRVPHAGCLNVGSGAYSGGSGDFSIETWIRTSDTGYNPIVNKWWSTGGYQLYLSAGILYFDLFVRVPTGSGGWSFASATYAGTAPLADGVWHHVAVCVKRNGSPKSLDLYADGGVDATFSNPVQGKVNNTRDLLIGSDQSTWFQFHGDLDEVSLYGSALTAADIGAIYSAGYGGNAGKCK